MWGRGRAVMWKLFGKMSVVAVAWAAASACAASKGTPPSSSPSTPTAARAELKDVGARLGSCDCPLEVRKRGNDLWQTGQHQAAMKVFLTCPREHLPNLAGLAAVHPPVWDELRKLRDGLLQNVEPPRVNDTVEFLDQLNSVLDDNEMSVLLFEKWRPYDDADRQALQRLIWRDLVQAWRYDLALAFEEMIQEGLDRSEKYLVQLRAENDEGVMDIEAAYSWQAAPFAAALFGVGRSAAAVDVVFAWTRASGRVPGSPGFCEFIADVGDLLDEQRRASWFQAVEEKFSAPACPAVTTSVSQEAENL